MIYNFDAVSYTHLDVYKRQDQIAASKEKGRDDKDWMKNLNGDEMKIIGEIMRQYFTGS